ncbi:arginine--tRNA ligase [Escherichia marmotae]|nr:arginine--tRNA ligase [Escherichia marmotae]
MNLQYQLSNEIKKIFIVLGDVDSSQEDPLVKPASRPEFGDYQVDGILSISKKKGIKPRDLAASISHELNKINYIEHSEIAGAGFINIRIADSYIIDEINKSIHSDRFNILFTNNPETIVVDYSSPNVAKEMHVGNIRSTIIGDAVVKTLEFLGHNVIRANHIGDWGTQFGMLIAYMEDLNIEDKKLTISELEEFYRKAKMRYDSDEVFSRKSRDYVVKLQGGNSYCSKVWEKLVNITMQQNQETYERLGVSLTMNDIMGESIYNSMLPQIVEDLKSKGIAQESQGATVVYLDEYRNRSGEIMGVIVQKQDGGFLYTTTDIACAKYRYDIYKADRILYYIDSRQNQHLLQAWEIARKAGYIPTHIKLEHHMFGMMLGKDGKPFKTRTGGTVKLSELTDEAVKRAKVLIVEKRKDLTDNEIEDIAEIIGIGAIKYSDLSKNRVTDYIFDWNNMLSFDGNTSPYIQYAYTRITSLLNKSQTHKGEYNVTSLLEEIEKKIARQLLRFEEIIEAVAKDGTPHVLCSYLYGLSVNYSKFYEECPILSATDSKVKNSRISLSFLTAQILEKGLDLLGIKVPSKM